MNYIQKTTKAGSSGYELKGKGKSMNRTDLNIAEQQLLLHKKEPRELRGSQIGSLF